MYFIKDMENGEKLMHYLTDMSSEQATDFISFKRQMEIINLQKLVKPETVTTELRDIDDIINDLDPEIVQEHPDMMKCLETLKDAVGDEATKRECIGVEAPSDIIIANTIPIKHMNIELLDSGCETKETYEVYVSDSATVIIKDGNTFKVTDTIIPLSDLKEYIMCMKEEDLENTEFVIGSVSSVSVGGPNYYRRASCLLTMDYKNLEINSPIIKDLYIEEGDFGFTFTTGRMDMDEYGAILVFSKLSMEVTNAITAFYSINVALLNPVIKEIYERKTIRVPMENVKKHSKNKTKQKIKYVKRHNMTIDDISTEFTKRGIVRKTMVWFVTGHWRKYKSGKRIFIQGYWKGALRELKSTIEPRERELVVNKV